jgi:hypothetical protein
MNTVDKLNNTLGYLTAMSFDRPELSNDLVEPLNTLSEAISEVENLSLSGVNQRRELLKGFVKHITPALEIDLGFDYLGDDDINDYLKTL